MFDFPTGQATQAIVDSVAGLVRDELQAPEPLWPFKAESASTITAPASPQGPWWKRLWRHPISN